MNALQWTAVRAAVLVTAVAGAAACQSGSPGASAGAPPASPPAAASSAAPPTVESGLASRAAILSVSKADACKQANEAFNEVLQALIDVAKPGKDPQYTAAELAPMREQVKKSTDRLSRLAVGSSDERLRTAIQALADAGAAYLPVTHLATAEKEGAAFSGAAEKLGRLCK
ncbi:hypothetical protein AB0J80_10395 [Actinoplanes sp. NPDC049548]|uniref:hypothetical protein n=1 Tax=Actinoplanes sp. NPDC049548 TaxID=3155152 RepID=UPI00343965AB